MARTSFGSIRKLPSGRYQARYHAGGERIAAPHTFPFKKAAQEWLAEQQTLLAKGEWKSPAQIAKEAEAIEEQAAAALASAAPFAQFAAQFEAHLVEQGRSENTTRTYHSNIERHLLPFFGKTAICDITPKMVRTWWATFPPSSFHPRRNAYRVLSSMMTLAVDRELIPVNPVKVKGALATPKRKHEGVVASPEQVAVMAGAMPESLAVMVWLAAYCGLRYGEIASLRRSDIDISGSGQKLAGSVSVRRSIKRTQTGALVEGPPKSRAGYRTVAIPASKVMIIKAHLDRWVEPGKDARVVSSFLDPLIPVSNKLLHTHFDPAAKKAGLPGMRFHDLRHTHLTWYGKAGATLAQLMARAGHSSVESVMVYQHADAAQDQILADQIG